MQLLCDPTGTLGSPSSWLVLTPVNGVSLCGSDINGGSRLHTIIQSSESLLLPRVFGASTNWRCVYKGVVEHVADTCPLVAHVTA